jgi:hypothetical protein
MALLLVTLAPASRAAEPVSAETAARAAALKKKGDDAMDALRYDEAIAMYSEAYGLGADPALLYNRGRVYQARSEYPQALADVERFDREASSELRARVPKLAELLVELRSHVSTLTVTCNVEGARVLVRDRQLGTTPLPEPTKLNAGPAVLEIAKEGYLVYRQELSLAGGESVVANVSLISKEKGGILAVRASGPGTVFVDGKPLGKPPLETTLDAGTHRILVRSDQFEDTETTAVVLAGERKEIMLDLEKRPSIFTRWWFWTAAGVVVAGGVAVTVALLTNKPAPSGDGFAPAQVRGPLTVAAW